MKIKKIFICFIIICLSGCSLHEKENNVQEEILYSFEQSTNLKDNEFVEIPFNFEYSFNNRGVALTYGLMVFIDGYIQEFSLENSPKNNFQIITISGKSLSEYTINIDQPLVNNKVSIHTVNIAGILNPTKTFDLKDYNVEHSLSQTINYSVQGQFKQSYDIKNFKFLYPKNNLNNSIIDSLNIDSNQLSQEVYFEFLQSDKTIIDTIDIRDKLKVRMFGKLGKYAVYAFADGKLYGNKPISVVQIDSNKYTELDINLDKYGCKNFFLIAASVENKDYIYQSSKFVLE